MTTQTPTRTRRRRLAAALTTVVATLAAGASAISSAPAADAINPNQTTYSGVVNILGGTSSYSIRNFWATTLPNWGYTYRNPTLKYYYSPVASGCGTLGMKNSFWCSTDWAIYLDYNWNQGLVTSQGDFSAGGVLAHEWGHAVDSMTRTRAGNYKDEYHADCMAGLYYRYAYVGGRLLGADYYEFYNWLYYQPYSASHGTGSIRASWFNYGYAQYTKAACDSVYRAGARTSVKAPTATGPIGTSSGTSVVPDSAPHPSLSVGSGAKVRPGQLPSLNAAPTTAAPSAALKAS